MSVTRIRVELTSWLDGPDVCACCGHTYAAELEARCGGCDDGLCPFCAEAAMREGSEGAVEHAACWCSACVVEVEAG